MKRNIKDILLNAAAVMSLGMAAVSCQDDMPIPDYTLSDEDVRVTFNLSLPRMEVKTRAALDQPSLNQVNSLWVRTYSALSGQATSEWVNVTEDLPTTDSEVPHRVTLDTKSGHSFIVGVANIDNMGVTKDNLTPRPLRELLAEADTWPEFLNIAVCSPADQQELNAPTVPLPMAGCYTNLAVDGDHTAYPHRIEDWQTDDFQSYFIPASSTGEITLTDGAIHLRRLVSHVKFNLTAGEDVTITPTSYQVFNAPAYSWLYERAADNGMTANFGDVCTQDNKETYYVSPAQFAQNNITSTTENNVTTYRFDYWQGENKHEAIQDITDYAQRDKEIKTSLLPDGTEPPSNDQYLSNTGIFTSLCGDKWTPNNMASYVLITCTVEYKEKLNVDDNGNPGGDKTVSRSGVANYLIHLGYMDGNAKDFNCYRNTDYTYNVKVLGLKQILVEAHHSNEYGGEYPGVEGQVADVENAPFTLDCHYGSFNVQLSELELNPYDDVTKTGFGFIMTTYENGVEHTYDETDFVNSDRLTADQLKYIGWVELKPTSGPDVRALYTPRGASGSTTFNLWDASKGKLTDDQKSDTGWYTVFVNEYAYEAENADESVQVNGKPLWASYVNQNPRRFYIRVTRSISADGQSIYSSSKYAGVQQSIMTYYSTQSFAEGSGARQSGSAVGVERTNESFGLNLRRSYGLNTSSGSGANNVDFSDENGRYNIYLWINSKGNSWDNFIQRTKFTKIPQGNTGIAGGAEYNVARLRGYEGGWTTNTAAASYKYQRSSPYDPQPDATTGLSATNDANYYIEAINACMNRNRDNNGNNVIDLDEIRWYVPAMGKYLRLILGNASLENPLMNYSKITQLTRGNGESYGNAGWNGPVGRYLFFASDGRVLWAMEGLSSSNWCQWGYNDPTYPWEVRCIRNLGLNLRVNQEGVATISSTDRTVPAYVFRQRSTNRQEGGVVSMSYYSLSSKRVNKLTANGTGAGQMPAHVISDRTYNSLYYNFEISQGRYQTVNTNNGSRDTLRYDIVYTDANRPSLSAFRNSIDNDNPCGILGDGWRVPNIKEVAIMRNLGLLKGLLSNDVSGFLMSATFSTFNNSGVNTGTLPTGTDLTNRALVARFDGLTQTIDFYAYGRSSYIRCVKDVD